MQPHYLSFHNAHLTPLWSITHLPQSHNCSVLVRVERSRSDGFGDTKNRIAIDVADPRTLPFALLLHQQCERFPVREIAFPGELLELV